MGPRVLALVVLPFALTGLLLLLSFIAILSHSILDTLHTYGVRWLMPFSGKWSYGDTLFIVDPLIWLVLGLGWGTPGSRVIGSALSRFQLRWGIGG